MQGNKLADGRTAEIFAWGTEHILKLYRPEFPHEADFEFELVNTVCAAGVNTPAAVELVQVNGRSGIIYERVEGKTMLAAVMNNPEQAIHFARQMADLHLAMHQQTATTLPNQHERMRHKIEQVEQLTQGEKTAVLHHLDQLPTANIVCHGDFHPDNMRKTFYNIYETHYLSQSTLTTADINAWLLPNAAARISEGLPPAFTDILLKIVRDLIQKTK